MTCGLTDLRIQVCCFIGCTNLLKCLNSTHGHEYQFQVAIQFHVHSPCYSSCCVTFRRKQIAVHFNQSDHSFIGRACLMWLHLAQLSERRQKEQFYITWIITDAPLRIHYRNLFCSRMFHFIWNPFVLISLFLCETTTLHFASTD